MAILNQKSINGLKARKSPFLVADTGTGSEPGLNVRVSKSGVITWTLKYTIGGRRHYQALGRWPEVGVALAREKARIFKGKLACGYNPLVIEDKATRATLGELLDSYYTNCQRREVKSLLPMRTFLRKIHKRHRDVPAGAVDAIIIHEILHPIATRTPTMANRVRTFLSSAFNYALREEYNLTRKRGELSFGVVRNPVTDVPMIKEAERTSDVVLTMENLAATFVHAPEYNSPTTVLAIQFHIASGGIRMYDSLHRRWDEFIEVEYDGRKVPCLRIPKDKSGKERVVPVGRHGMEILERLWQLTSAKEVMFPARSSSRIPVSTIGIGQATRKLREYYPSMGEFSSRFVRRCAKTELGNAGVDRLSLDIFHGHQIRQYSSVATRHYDYSHQLSHKLSVIGAWDKLLDSAIAEYLRAEQSCAAQKCRR